MYLNYITRAKSGGYTVKSLPVSVLLSGDGESI